MVYSTYCVLFFFALCTLCCQFLLVVHFWLHLWYSLTFIFEYVGSWLDDLLEADLCKRISHLVPGGLFLMHLRYFIVLLFFHFWDSMEVFCLIVMSSWFIFLKGSVVIVILLRLGRDYSVQHYVIKFVSDVRQVSCFLLVLWFPPQIKLTATI